MNPTYVTYETGSSTVDVTDDFIDAATHVISTTGVGEFTITPTATMATTPKKKKAATTAISEEVSKTAKPTGKPQYMVSVDGHTAPMLVHSTIEAARKEAERLHSTGSANGNTVRVLLVVGTYKPTYTWEDWL